MDSLIAGWIAAIILGLVNAVLGALSSVMTTLGHASLGLAQQPWVGQATDVTAAVAGSLLGLVVAWKAVSEYIIWNEGSDAPAGAVFFKGVLRVGLYGGGGAALAYAVFRFGYGLASALMVAPVAATAHRLTILSNTIGVGNVNAPLNPVFETLLLALGLLACVVAIVIVVLQMFVRGAELAVFIVASPIVALGWLSPGGGVWQNWWRQLVVLSLSTAVQWLCLHGLIATVATTMLTTTAGPILGICEIGAWAWVALKGPHLLQTFAYRTGFASGISTYVGGYVRSLRVGGIMRG